MLMLTPLMAATPFRWANIPEGNGVAVAITGMVIVFLALTVITVFISLLPKILDALEPYLPTAEHHGAPPPAEGLPQDQEKVIAAIGLVLHTEMQKAMKNN